MTYEDIEHDKSAIWQAVIIVVLVSAATVVGELLLGEDTVVWWAIVRGVIRGSGKLGRLGVVHLARGRKLPSTLWTPMPIGDSWQGPPDTPRHPVSSTSSFSSPAVAGFVYFVTFVWTFACMVVAVRQSLDYKSTLRAVIVILLAFIPVVVLNFIVLGLTGGLDLTGSGSGGGFRTPIILR